ncbi:translin isoform X2 [Carlito syrichta]|uniref:Translin n=1 Tax=Carlito syrichta TaxID=1868482 RepID=A0A3Q0EF87_CARSF|nr:translin isoform X2 [Carlito syrichta]
MSVSEIFVELQGFLAAEQDIREASPLPPGPLPLPLPLSGWAAPPGPPPSLGLGRRGRLRGFHEHWRFVLQRLVFLAAFVVYLETETLVTREAVTEILGIEPDREKGFHLDVEDYLSGVLILASELSRLSVNSVTAGDYARPLHISTFINELDSGFRLLNLKNDSLRKRYDGLKYDVKKVEEVVYDLSIRGFNKETAAACVEK